MQIQSSFDDILFKDVPLACRVILSDAKTNIDNLFGDGYAKDHPKLVAAYMRVAGTHLNTSSALKVFECLAEAGCFKPAASDPYDPYPEMEEMP
jgi:hypothetical protein